MNDLDKIHRCIKELRKLAEEILKSPLQSIKVSTVLTLAIIFVISAFVGAKQNVPYTYFVLSSSIWVVILLATSLASVKIDRGRVF